MTTSQGIQLFSNAGVRRFYRGIVRNVEQTDEAELPEAVTRVDDVEASDAGLFLVRLKRQSCFLLHLVMVDLLPFSNYGTIFVGPSTSLRTGSSSAPQHTGRMPSSPQSSPP